MKDEFTFEETDFFGENTNEKVKRLQSESKKIVKDKKIFRRFLEKQYNKVSSIEEITGLPQQAEQIRIITQKSFNAYAILLFLVEKVNIEECYLTTYNVDKNTIHGLRQLVESGNIKKITLLVSDSINFRMPDRASELKKLAKDLENIRLIFAWNHTKIITAKTSDGVHYVIEGSGNLSDNARIEQYLFEQCKETYNFHKDWIEGIRELGLKEVKVYG